MLIELLRPAGTELGRRWLAALLLAPEDEREAIVDSVERRMIEAYRSGAGRSPADEEGGGLRAIRTPERTELRGLAAASGLGGDSGSTPTKKKTGTKKAAKKASRGKRG